MFKVWRAGESPNDVPKYSYQEKNEVERDGDFLHFPFQRQFLPVIHQSQAEEEASQSSSQMTELPVGNQRESGEGY